MVASIRERGNGSERISTLGELVAFEAVPEPRYAGDVIEADVTRHCPASEYVPERVVVEYAGHQTGIRLAWLDANRNGVMDPGDRLLMDPEETRKVARVRLATGLDLLAVCRVLLARLQGRGRRA